MWVCYIWPLLCWDSFPLFPLSGELLSYMAVELCQSIFCINLHDCMVFAELRQSFFASVEMTVLFLFFNLAIWPITLIDLHRLKNSSILGIIPTWTWYMILLMCLWIQFVSILLRIFTSIFISDIGLFLWYLCLVSGWQWPIEWPWEWRIYKCCSENTEHKHWIKKAFWTRERRMKVL